jgi:hypothetical protein
MKNSNVIPMPRMKAVSRPTAAEEQIRFRAYQLYEERGKIDGFELDDWLRAEAEIMSHQVRRKAS